jgi:hypothetical protein
MSRVQEIAEPIRTPSGAELRELRGWFELDAICPGGAGKSAFSLNTVHFGLGAPDRRLRLRPLIGGGSF